MEEEERGEGRRRKSERNSSNSILEGVTKKLGDSPKNGMIPISLGNSGKRYDGEKTKVLKKS